MASRIGKPLIAFVWRAKEISSSVVEMARQTKTRVVFDLSSIDPESVSDALLHADASRDAVDLKISPEVMMAEELEDFLKDTNIDRLWVEIHPVLIEGDVGPYLERIVRVAGRVTIIPVISSVELLFRVLDGFPRVNTVALKGSEASGFVSGENTFTLYSAIRQEINDRGQGPDLVVWGGVATPEAAAAFLATGAGGIVFESLHWLTDLAMVEDEVRHRIAALRPSHTSVAGLNLGVPCRLFDKGNSKAVRDLNTFAGSLCGSEIRDEQRRFFAERVSRESVNPLEGRFGRDELIPLGVEAAFAGSFVRRFGSGSVQAIDRFVEAIDRCLAQSATRMHAFVDSDAARAMGTQYPFVQGAMSWITDVPEFAEKVARAGGLPTVALGMMNPALLEEKLANLSKLMGKRPYAVNVITLAENPYREAQLAWIRRVKPSFAVIAAGEPSHAGELLAEGIDVIYIAPNEELLRLAFEAGVRIVVCEGNEAGGHVGEYSTLTWSQILLDLHDREPELFEGRIIILAGGIYNRETAFMAAVVGADAIQMGTAYLATKEIVETGALTSLYQRMVLNSKLGGTTITGQVAGLRVRSLRTPKIEAVCSLEREFAAGVEDEATFRKKIEALAAGSLFTAARGMDRPGGAIVDESICLNEGQFMSGACAGALKTVCTLESLHAELAHGKLAEGLPVTGPIRDMPAVRPVGVEVSATVTARSVGRRSSVYRDDRLERIAVTGLALLNSLGNSPEEVWAASMAMKSGITEVPSTRWDHGLFYHPKPRTPEKTYCRVGAFQNIEVSRKELGIPPQDFKTMTAATKLTMWLAKKAIEDSGILQSEIPRERIAVLISQNSGEAAATLEDVIIRGSANKIATAVGKALGLSPEAQRIVEEEVKSGRIVIDDTTLLGRLNCSAGGFICNRYGFMGPSFSVSAACATALVALYSAYQMIRNGVIDAAVVGGAEEYLTPMHFLEFSALGALAGLSGLDRRPGEFSRPFDADRDGMVLGEGGGMIVIERESVARSRGARVHGYITSMGASNNHLGMVESSRQTQEIAIGASFKEIAYGPAEVNLVECHATSTRQGDVEEVEALKTFFGTESTTVLASFKSQIGHTLGASGVNSLIRGIMAMKAGVFPPNLNYEVPDPEIGIEGSGLLIPTEPTQWTIRNGLPKRFQVNAFGFGGSNYVVQVEQALEGEDMIMVAPEPRVGPREDDAESVSIPDGVFCFTAGIATHSYRVGVVADSEEAARESLAKSDAFSNGESIAVKRLRALARQGIHIGSMEGAPPALAFVFPGQGSHYAGMGYELYQTFPVIKQWMDRASQVAEFDLLKLLFFDSEEDLQKTRWQQPALFTMEYAMVQYLWSLGIRPVAMAGHSLGELTALCLAGVYSFEDGFRLVNKRAVCMDKACEMNADPGVMMATDAPLEMLKEILSHRDRVYVTNINSPRQVVLGGDTEAVNAVGAELKGQGYRTTLLRVSMAFHSPIMRCIRDELQQFIEGIQFHPPKIPVVSNTTRKPFSNDVDEIKRTVMAHLESPVHWMQNVRTLVSDFGVKLFVEVGPREVLSNLIADTLEEADCVQTCLPSAEVVVYKTALAQLYARGNLKVRTVSRLVPATAGIEAPSSQTSVSAPPSGHSPGGGARPALDTIVQRQINSFIVESFGRFLKPTLLDAIRKEYDPTFAQENLESLLRGMFPDVAPPTPIALPSVAEPLPVQAEVVAPERMEPLGPVPVEAQAGRPETGDVTETVIRIIMDATGYEREEIEPDMDLREDLSIRSSRLPVIMDSLEARFNMKIELEDFMDVRTIRDIGKRISEVLARHAVGAVSPERVTAAAHSEILASAQTREEAQSIKRIVFRESLVKPGSFQPVELSLMEEVVIFSAEAGAGLRKAIGDVFRRDYGATVVPLTFMGNGGEKDGSTCDLRSKEGAAQAQRELSLLESPAGLVFIVDDIFDGKIVPMEDISALLRGFFQMIKAFTESPARKFVLAVQGAQNDVGIGRLFAEGVLGMLLSAGHEFGSVLFRCLRLDAETDVREAIRGALDRALKPVQIVYRQGRIYTLEGRPSYAAFDESAHLELGSDDVVVFSGGAYGITPFLARSLVPFRCRMVFLGRTVLDPDVDFRRLLVEQGTMEQKVDRLLGQGGGTPAGNARQREKEGLLKALKIVSTVEDLRSHGIDASYMTCNVTESGKTRTVIEKIVDRYGKVDGIVHAAGVLRDRFVKQMTPEDFQEVVDVKFLGAWNLFSAARELGLRFFACLSSAAAVQGNPGQVNYAAANRMMSALMTYLRNEVSSLRCKALILPPIEGAGMAEDPDIRALMARMNATYVHVEELAALFDRELFIAPADDVWTMFMRSLPDLSTVRIEVSDPEPAPGEMPVATVTFRHEDFPMVDSVSSMDLLTGVIDARRTFSHDKDLWISDHKPFEFLRFPLVSAIMALETFMEVSRMLYPHLSVIGVRNAEFIEIIACPPDTPRSSEIGCRRVSGDQSEVICEVSLSTREISPTGRLLDRTHVNYRAQVILGIAPRLAVQELEAFPVRPEELDTRPMDNPEVLRKYGEQTDLQGRYRVIHDLDGTGPGSIRGHVIYRHTRDFSSPSKTIYQYSPYLLEALMQLGNFYTFMRDSNEDRTLIPYSIGEVRFTRKCTDGERVVVEGRMRNQDKQGITLDLRGLDVSDHVLMVVKDLRMRWFTK